MQCSCASASAPPIPFVVEVARQQHVEAEIGVLAVVVGGVEPAAQADLDGPMRVDQPLLRRAAEDRPVGDLVAAEVRIPRVRVRIELEQRELPVRRRRGAQERQRHGVVAAEADDRGPAFIQGARVLLDRGVRLDDVDRARRRVARVDDLQLIEREHVERLVVRLEQQRRLADPGRPEARATAERGAEVDRSAEHRDVRRVHVLETREPREGPQPEEARDVLRVDLSGALRGVLVVHHRDLT